MPTITVVSSYTATSIDMLDDLQKTKNLQKIF